MARTVELAVGGTIIDWAAQVRALLPKGHVLVSLQAHQQARIMRARIVEDTRLPNRERVYGGDLYLWQALRTPIPFDAAKHGEGGVGKKGRQRHPDERLGKLTPRHKVVIYP
jgi:hypothetical protein